jgi:hypothetical protein
MLAKILYTILLVGGGIFLFREAYIVWWDERLFIGKFAVVGDSSKEAEAGTKFAASIVGSQAIIARQLVDYQSRRSSTSPTDVTFVPPDLTPVGLPPAALSGMELKLQSVNIGEMVNSLRKSIAFPNEVNGTVTKRDGSVSAAVNWPDDGVFPTAAGVPSGFLTPSQPDEASAASYIAATIIWARAAQANKDLSKYSHAQFSDFALALTDLYALSENATKGKLSDEALILIRRRAAQLRSHYGQKPVYPDVYRLRADLLELLPHATQQELTEAQDERLKYVMLSPKLATLPAEERRYAAMAVARPAIAYKDGAPADPPDNWASLLSKRVPELKRLADAVGSIHEPQEDKAVASGVIVAQGLLLTASFALTKETLEFGAKLAPDKRQSFCLGDPANCAAADRLTLGNVVYLKKTPESHIALVELLNHNPAVHPPALVAETPDDVTSLVGQYSVLVGFPQAISAAFMPVAFVKHLLHGKSGVKRLMPGRVLAAGRTVSGSAKIDRAGGPAYLTTDVSSMSGTAGGPLADLTTGKIIGMNFAGEWREDKGKFAYAEVIPKDALDIITGRADPAQTPPRQAAKSVE